MHPLCKVKKQNVARFARRVFSNVARSFDRLLRLIFVEQSQRFRSVRHIHYNMSRRPDALVVRCSQQCSLPVNPTRSIAACLVRNARWLLRKCALWQALPRPRVFRVRWMRARQRHVHMDPACRVRVICPRSPLSRSPRFPLSLSPPQAVCDNQTTTRSNEKSFRSVRCGYCAVYRVQGGLHNRGPPIESRLGSGSCRHLHVNKVQQAHHK